MLAARGDAYREVIGAVWTDAARSWTSET